MLEYLDPFGAPELWVDRVAAREFVSAGVVRLVLVAFDRREPIVKVKLLTSPAALSLEQARSLEFLRNLKPPLSAV